MNNLLPPIASGAPSVVSLFSGIGGIDLAFTWAGFNIVAQVEIDPFCRAVLAKHSPAYWPNAVIHEDVKHVGRENLPYAPDVIVGGFPCQDISTAGKGAGIKEGTRSGLWLEFARVIGEIRPRFVFLENVAAITARDGIRVVADLAALGYDAEWRIVAAADVGAPHRRERWFCVAYDMRSRYSRENDQVSAGRHTVDACRPASVRSLADTESRGNRGERFCQAETQSIARQENDGTIVNGEGRAVGVGHDSNSANGEAWRPDGMGIVNGVTRSPEPPTHQSMDHATSGRCEQRDANERGVREFDAGRSIVVNANDQRCQEQRGGIEIPPQLSSIERTGPAGREIAPKPRLGIATHGLPGRLVRWPARPGEAQYEWEAPRTTTETIPQRTAKLKALGNAVVPQVIYPFAVAIYEMRHGDADREAAR